MNEYLLFVDTETSGLPLDWNKPYSAEGNWPYIVQLAWIIFTADGRELKRENHFIRAKDYKISNISREIHGITDQFLEEMGEERRAVMQLIHDDLMHYKPLVIGHFMQLDYHMLGLGFYRAGLDNPLKQLPSFCTMKLTKDFLLLPGHKYMRLPQLYERLFRTPMKQEHNALVDALATAHCFFELKKRGDVNEQIIQEQKQVYRLQPVGDQPVQDAKFTTHPKKSLTTRLVLLLVLLAILIILLWLL